MCPHVTRDMIRVVLNKLKAESEIVCRGRPGCYLAETWEQTTGYLKWEITFLLCKLKA